jgi:KUP system potassium uptake protein
VSLDHQEKTSSKKLAVLTLAALGVVYGDIGTSPLYAIKEIFFSHHHSVAIERTNILGALSLVVWALTIIVTFKYIVYVLRADYGGHGGVFALYALLKKKKLPGVIVVSGLLMLAAGLLFGDGMITPAISVISAVEGLSLITSAFDSYVVPITIAILVLLFLVQKKGTAKIGRIFGPITTIWFIVIGLLGLRYVLLQPEILLSFNPWLAVRFVLELPFKNLLLILGSVMLVIAGGEAMYADLGHFGKQPIRIGWFSLVYPALLLNYLGQGAYLLSGQAVINSNIFFSMVPTFMLIPMVVLATLATIIASQALITGVFSLTAQAISLGLIPWVKVLHTHQDQEGQIYVPIINKALLIGCVLLVLIFRSSSGLASAYGLAVSGDMLVTSIAMILLSKYLWKWSWLKIGGVIIPLLVLESLFLTAN